MPEPIASPYLVSFDGGFEICKLIRRTTNKPVQCARWDPPTLRALTRFDFFQLWESSTETIAHAHRGPSTNAKFLLDIHQSDPTSRCLHLQCKAQEIVNLLIPHSLRSFFKPFTGTILCVFLGVNKTDLGT